MGGAIQPSVKRWFFIAGRVGVELVHKETENPAQHELSFSKILEMELPCSQNPSETYLQARKDVLDFLQKDIPELYKNEEKRLKQKSDFKFLRITKLNTTAYNELFTR